MLFFVFLFSSSFRNICFFEMRLGILGVFYTINLHFDYRVRILCIWLYMGIWLKTVFDMFWDCFKKKSQKCEHFSYGPFVLRCFRIWAPKWSLYVAEASLHKCRTNLFKICSYIQTNTTNPIHTFTMTVYITKHTKNT